MRSRFASNAGPTPSITRRCRPRASLCLTSSLSASPTCRHQRTPRCSRATGRARRTRLPSSRMKQTRSRLKWQRMELERPRSSSSSTLPGRHRSAQIISWIDWRKRPLVWSSRSRARVVEPTRMGAALPPSRCHPNLRLRFKTRFAPRRVSHSRSSVAYWALRTMRSSCSSRCWELPRASYGTPRFRWEHSLRADSAGG